MGLTLESGVVGEQEWALLLGNARYLTFKKGEAIVSLEDSHKWDFLVVMCFQGAFCCQVRRGEGGVGAERQHASSNHYVGAWGCSLGRLDLRAVARAEVFHCEGWDFVLSSDFLQLWR